MKTPFTTPRAAGETPYWLRNGVADSAYLDASMEEHRRRIGISCTGSLPTDYGYLRRRYAEERAVVDKLLEDISAGKISAARAIPALQEWRKQHDR